MTDPIKAAIKALEKAEPFIGYSAHVPEITKAAATEQSNKGD